MVRNNAVFLRMMTAPGVGSVVALQLSSPIFDSLSEPQQAAGRRAEERPRAPAADARGTACAPAGGARTPSPPWLCPPHARPPARLPSRSPQVPRAGVQAGREATICAPSAARTARAAASRSSASGKQSPPRRRTPSPPHSQPAPRPQMPWSRRLTPWLQTPQGPPSGRRCRVGGSSPAANHSTRFAATTIVPDGSPRRGSASPRRPPGPNRVSPVDPFEQVTQLRRAE